MTFFKGSFEPSILLLKFELQPKNPWVKGKKKKKTTMKALDV